MKAITAYLGGAARGEGKRAPAGSSTSSKADEETLDLVHRLFAEFAVEFRERWSSALQDERMYALTEAKYADALRGSTWEDIERGLRCMPVGQNEWPPGPRAFRQYAGLHKSRAPEHRPYVALPAPSADPEVARKALDQATARLRGNTADGATGKEPDPLRFESDPQKRARKRERIAAALCEQGVPKERVKT